MSQTEKMNKMSDAIRAILEENGFDQFVLVGHNCQAKQTFVCSTPRPCGEMQMMQNAISIVQANNGHLKYLGNDQSSLN